MKFITIVIAGIFAITGGSISAMQPEMIPAPSPFKIIRDKNKTEEQKIAEIADLVAHGICVDIRNADIPYFTPLMLASDLGYTTLVKALLNLKADVNVHDELNNTALFWAARKGHLDVVRVLLEHHADVRPINKQGNTILLDILRSYGANLHEAKDKKAFKNNIYEIINLLTLKGADVNFQGAAAEVKRSPIMWAAFWKEWKLVKLLQSRKADICLKDHFGNNLAFYLPVDYKKEGLSDADAHFVDTLKSAITLLCKRK